MITKENLELKIHKINNILTPILGNTSMIRLKYPNETYIQELTETTLKLMDILIEQIKEIEDSLIE